MCQRTCEGVHEGVRTTTQFADYRAVLLTTALPADYCAVRPITALPADYRAACRLLRSAALPAVGGVVVHVIVGRVLAKLPLDEKHHQDG